MDQTTSKKESYSCFSCLPLVFPGQFGRLFFSSFLSRDLRFIDGHLEPCFDGHDPLNLISVSSFYRYQFINPKFNH